MSAVSSIPADNAAAAEARQRAAEARYAAELNDHIGTLELKPIPEHPPEISDARAVWLLTMAVARLMDRCRGLRTVINDLSRQGTPAATVVTRARRVDNAAAVVAHFAVDVNDAMTAAGSRWGDRAACLDAVREGVHRVLIRHADALDELHDQQNAKLGQPELTAADRNGL